MHTGYIKHRNHFGQPKYPQQKQVFTLRLPYTFGVIYVWWVGLAVVQEGVVTDDALHNPSPFSSCLEEELTGRVSDIQGLHVVIDVT